MKTTGGKYRKVLLGVLAVGFCFPLLATQEKQYLITHWGDNSGLPQNSVSSIIQTRDGYLWLSTYGGLARFDGLRFTIFDTGNTPGLGSNRFVKLKEDRQGNLWIFPEEETGVLQWSGQQFIHYHLGNGLPSNHVEDVLLDRNGRLWLATQKGLCRFERNIITTYTTAQGLSNDWITWIFEDSGGTIWIGTKAGLTRWDENRITRLSSLFPSPQPGITYLGVDKTGRILIGTSTAMYTLEGGKIKPLFLFPISNQIQFAPQISQDRDGGFWFSYSQGLHHWWQGKTRSLTTRDGLSSNQVRCSLVDREGNIWVGTEGAGLNRMTESKIRSFGPELEMPGASVVPISGDGQGGLWIGGNGEGLFHFTNGKATCLGGSKEGLSDAIWSLLLDRQGTLWAGTWGRGVFRIDPKSQRPRQLSHELSNPVVCSLFQDRDGTVWIGTQNGLNRYRDDRITVFNTTGGLVADDIKFITQDSQGDLWIGTTGGLSRMGNGRFTNYTTNNGLANNYVRAVHEDADSVIWIGTYGGGLSRFQDGRFFHYNTQNGLYDNVVSRIIEDRSGNFWMTCNRGIFRASRRELNDFFQGKSRQYTCYHYGIDEGMLSSECNGGGQPAGWLDEADRLWFPTIKGVVMVDPARGNPVPPSTVIESVRLDGSPLALDKKIVLPPGKKRLEFNYTGISFTAAEKVRFRFFLEGFDDQWTGAGSARSTSYTNLSRGIYTFHVKAANNEGIWSEREAVVRFEVLPFFYQSYWFIGLCLVLAGGIVFGLYGLRISRLKARERTLQKLVTERTRELAQTNDKLEQSNMHLEEANRLLERLSNLDGLTGIANRRYFEQFIENEWRRAQREQWPLGVIMIDVDHFKEYNDLYGHLAGDDCLKKVAEALGVVNRAGDLVARYGGEEFVVVVSHTDRDGTLYIARAMQERVNKMALPHERSSVSPLVTISLGVACTTPIDASEYMELVMASDQALYRAKQSGRNCISESRLE